MDGIAYDVDRYSRLKEALRIEDYEFFGGNGTRRNYERACFVNGVTLSPNLDYPRLSNEEDVAELDRCYEVLLTELLQIVDRHPQLTSSEWEGWPKGLRDEQLAIDYLYVKKIDEKMAMIGMLKAAAMGDDQAVHDLSADIYPDCDPNVALLTVRLLRGRVRMAFSTCDNEDDSWERPVYEAAEDLNNHLRQFPATDQVTMRSTFPMPKLPRLRQMFLGFEESQGELMRLPWEQLFPGQEYVSLVNMKMNDPRRQRLVTTDEEHRIFNRAAKLLDPTWEAAIRKGGSAASVSYETQKIWVPDSRPALMTYQNWFSLYVHEILRHLARHTNGHKTGFALLGESLAGYLAAEEGITVYSEYMVGKVGFLRPVAGMDTHFALALSTGVIDGVKRNFEQTYEIYYAADRLTRMLRQRRLINEIRWASKEGRPLRTDPIYTIAECDAQAQRESYDVCVRIFRGTTCSSAGQVYGKDSVYWVGLRKIAKLVAELGDNADKAMPLWLDGKFDPTDTDTLKALSSFPWFRDKLAAAGIVL